jgi:hypothetical protein
MVPYVTGRRDGRLSTAKAVREYLIIDFAGGFAVGLMTALGTCSPSLSFRRRVVLPYRIRRIGIWCCRPSHTFTWKISVAEWGNQDIVITGL